MVRNTDGFGSDQGRQLIELSAKNNRRPYRPLTDDQMTALRAAGFVIGPKAKPKITPAGRAEILSVEEAMWEDIDRECREVGVRIPSGLLVVER